MCRPTRSCGGSTSCSARSTTRPRARSESRRSRAAAAIPATSRPQCSTSCRFWQRGSAPAYPGRAGADAHNALGDVNGDDETVYPGDRFTCRPRYGFRRFYGAQDCPRFRPGTAHSVRRLRARRHRSAGFLDKAAKYAVGGMTAAMLLDELSPKFAEAQQVAKPTTSASRPSTSSTPPRRATARCAAISSRRRTRRKLPGDSRRAREPRAESAYRGHRAPPRARQLHGLRARRAVPARRLSRATKTRRASCSRSSIRRRRAKTSWRR